MQNCFFVFMLLVVLFTPVDVIAGGFLIYNQDAAATSLGLAYTAQVNNPSAVLYNPAAINQLKGTQYEWGGTLILYQSEFKNARTGKKTEQDEHHFYLPTFYATRALNNHWSVGIGSFSHFGLTTDWPSDWEGRYLSTYAQLRSSFVNGVISYQITANLSIAAGLNVAYSDVKQKNNIRAGMLRDGRAKFEADDFGWGYNFAMLYTLSDKLKLGLTYRSQVRMHYKGDLDFVVPKFLNNLVPEGGARVNIDLPAFATGGVSYTLWKKLTVELDIIWADWSTYDKLALKTDKKVPKIMAKSAAPIIRDYRDTIDFAFGLSFKATESLTLRAGYLFDPSPVPEENTDPILPGADKNIFAMGLGYKRGKWTLDVTSYFSFYKDRHVRRNRNGFNGTYESFANLIGLNITYCP